MSAIDPSDTAYSRRGFLSVSSALAGTMLLAEAQPSGAQQQDAAIAQQAAQQKAVAPGATANPPVETLATVLWDLIAANRVLAHFNLIDGLGHVSVRNPSNPNSYLQTASITPAPELSTLDNLGEFDFDNRPLDTKGRPSWPERMIFGAIYRMRPDVGAIVHCHPPDIVLMSIIDEPARPVYHMAGFVGDGLPVFDLSDVVGHDTNEIIGNLDYGQHLAEALGDKPAVLMRGHGCAVVGKDIAQVIGRVVYLNINCQLQTRALGLVGRKVRYLSPGEIRLTDKNAYIPDWQLWKAEVMANSRSLYSTVG